MKGLLKTLTNPHGAIIDAVVKVILKQFKLDKILSYVEDPNELDKGLKDALDIITLQQKEIESIKDLVGSKQQNSDKQVDKSEVGMVKSDHDPIRLLNDRLDMHEKDLLKVFDKMDAVETQIKQLAYLVKNR